MSCGLPPDLFDLPDALVEVAFDAPHVKGMNREALHLFGYTEEDFAAGIEPRRLCSDGEFDRAMTMVDAYVGRNVRERTPYARTGLLLVCAWCKDIRDDEGAWHPIESYVRARTDARFSHGICPRCRTERYPGV